MDRVLGSGDEDQMSGTLVDEVNEEEDDLLDDAPLLENAMANRGGAMMEMAPVPLAVTLAAGEEESLVDWACRTLARAGSVIAAGQAAEPAPTWFKADDQQQGSAPATAGQRLAAAGIREATSSPTRASPRLAGVTDQHTMEKAKKRAAWKEFRH